MQRGHCFHVALQFSVDVQANADRGERISKMTAEVALEKIGEMVLGEAAEAVRSTPTATLRALSGIGP